MMRTLGHLYMAFCALILAAPIVVVCGAALNGGRSMLFPPQDPTLARFGEFFVSEPVWTTALTNSVIVALGAATLAVLLAWPVAYLLWSTGSQLSKILAGLGSLPFAVPPIVFGVGLGFFWGFAGGLGDLWAGVVSHAILL
ncbi:MAG: ABC transporter permease, partial [Roseicyclus sp.]